MKFRGGYTFKNFNGAAEPVFFEAPLPGKAAVSVKNVPGIFTVVVKSGDNVKAGQKIAESADEIKTCIYAPVSGTVSNIDSDYIHIISDKSQSVNPVEGHTREPWHLSHSDALELFCRTGCSLLLGKKYSGAGETENVKNIIINAVHNSPLGQKWTPEISGTAENLINGLKSLKSVFIKAEITFAVNKRNRKFFDNPVFAESAKTMVMKDRYPQENPEVLSLNILNKPLISPEGKNDDSVIVLRYEDLILISGVMTQGSPLIEKIVLLAGTGVSKPGWYRLRIGTTFGEIRKTFLKSEEFGPWRIIKGDPLSGKGVGSDEESICFDDYEISVITDKAERQLLQFVRPGFDSDSYSKSTVSNYVSLIPKKIETNLHGGVRPCVQCNFCDEVCPVNLYPFLIWKNVEAELYDDCFRIRPYDCVECGLCDYVCPSKISLLESVRKAKAEYRKSREGK